MRLEGREVCFVQPPGGALPADPGDDVGEVLGVVCLDQHHAGEGGVHAANPRAREVNLFGDLNLAVLRQDDSHDSLHKRPKALIVELLHWDVRRCCQGLHVGRNLELRIIVSTSDVSLDLHCTPSLQHRFCEFLLRTDAPHQDHLVLERVQDPQLVEPHDVFVVILGEPAVKDQDLISPVVVHRDGHANVVHALRIRRREPFTFGRTHPQEVVVLPFRAHGLPQSFTRLEEFFNIVFPDLLNLLRCVGLVAGVGTVAFSARRKNGRLRDIDLPVRLLAEPVHFLRLLEEH
mmetsp:Transcript_96607/g.242335  ORF Transcript_96607/g.242335 Transcript_96607/m.242335 type:complete len:290 (+) Transcript_96607:512-1381(+)